VHRQSLTKYVGTKIVAGGREEADDDARSILHALGGRLSLAAFATATTIATAIAVPETTASTPRMMTTVVLAFSAIMGWSALFTWHWFGRGKPVKLTPLLRIFRR
jgi:hypothetical protein